MGRVLSTASSLNPVTILLAIAIIVGLFSVSAVADPAIAATSEESNQESVSGAAFTTPESLEDEVEDFRERTPRDLAPNAFVLANHDNLYLVFTDANPRSGKATVDGRSLPGEISANGMSFNIILASGASFRTYGEEATIDEITSRPDEYQQELVQVQAVHRRVSVLNDPDQGQDVTAAVTSGVLVNDPTTTGEMFSRPGQKARSLSINTSSEELSSNADQEINQLLATDQPRLYTVDFIRYYWSDAEQTVDGIVLTPGSKAREFISIFDKTGTVKSDANSPLLYVVNNIGYPDAQFDSIQSVKSDATDGKIVQITANLYGQRVSTQETLRTSTPCGDSQVQVPTPSGPICIDVVQDIVMDLGVAWTSTPTSEEDLLFVAGVSSRHLDQPSEQLRGEYRIIGEVVSTDRFDKSLPEGKMLIIYGLERVGETSYRGLDSGTQNRIQNRFTELNQTARNQLLKNSDPIQTTTSDQSNQGQSGSATEATASRGSDGDDPSNTEPSTTQGAEENENEDSSIFSLNNVQSILITLLIIPLAVLPIVTVVGLSYYLYYIKGISSGVDLNDHRTAAALMTLASIAAVLILIVPSVLMNIPNIANIWLRGAILADIMIFAIAVIWALTEVTAAVFDYLGSHTDDWLDSSISEEMKSKILKESLIALVLGLVFLITGVIINFIIGFVAVIFASLIIMVIDALRVDPIDISSIFSSIGKDWIPGIGANVEDTADFTTKLRCGNCGNRWEQGFERGNRVLQIQDGVAVQSPGSNRAKIFCPVCALEEEVNVEDREPVE